MKLIIKALTVGTVKNKAVDLSPTVPAVLSLKRCGLKTLNRTQNTGTAGSIEFWSHQDYSYIKLKHSVITYMA